MRFPLNPCDYHFYTLQRAAGDAMACRFKAAMGFDVEGGVDGEVLRQRMRYVVQELPVLAGRLRFSAIMARPGWQTDGADRAIDDVYRFEDVSGAAGEHSEIENDDRPPRRRDATEVDHRPPQRGDATDVDDRPPQRGDATADAAMERAASRAIDLSRAPLVHLHHIRTHGFDRVLLTWPHPLMDGQGGYEVLRRLAVGDDNSSSPCASADESSKALNDLLGSRVSRAMRGYGAQRAVSRIQTTPPPTGAIDYAGGVRFARRLGSAESFEAIAAAAKKLTPAGPGLYARHLAACTIRALRRLYDKHGWTTPSYAISFPMRPGGITVRSLPLGNYLVAAMLHVPHEIALDWPRLGEAIAKQITDFTASGADRDQWALLWASSLMRPGQYHAMMKSSVATTPLISGYSYFQAEDENPIEQFQNRSILRMLFGGVVTIPPGWNPAFWRHGRKISMTLAWPFGFIDDALALEFADLIEAEALCAG